MRNARISLCSEPRRIALVVEGYGDREAVPAVIRRYLQSIEEWNVSLGKPLKRKGRGNLIKQGQLERFVRQALASPEPAAFS